MRRARLIANKRAEFSRRTRLDAFVRSGGRCEHGISEYGNDSRCHVKFTAGDAAHYDHIIAASNGGDNSLSNCAVLCRVHHQRKTSELDIPRAAKTERLIRKHVAGIR